MYINSTLALQKAVQSRAFFFFFFLETFPPGSHNYTGWRVFTHQNNQLNASEHKNKPGNKNLKQMDKK